ncbi:MAG: hypothetical protein DMD31_02785 [Gemmatimonadetes bacterium]|nr:MAG: hypothetical protein DMD31_02785 [Gemmatimonadota bacterium]
MYRDTVVVSAGEAVGSPARVPVEFVVQSTAASPPDPPTALAQLQSDGSTAIAVGGTATSRSVVFRGGVSDPAGGQLRLEVEVEPVGTAFTGASSGSGGAVASGGSATATVAGLSDNAAYHWQARTVDQAGDASAWAAFGGNAETEADFRVALAGTQLVFTVQPSNATAGAAIAPAVQVTAQDPQGSAVTSFTGNVTVAIGTNQHGGTLAGTKQVAAVAGVATFSDLSIDRAGGGYTLQATGASLSTVSTPFTISPGAGSRLAFTVQPSNAQAGTAITPAVKVTAYDAAGNTATSFTGSITVAIGTNPSSATLSGNAPVSAVNGVATFASLSIDKPGTGYTLAASASGLTGAPSNAFDITAQPPPPNQPPVAAFTPSCTYLVCSFTDASSDPDGSVAGWRWTFGDGGTATTQSPSHTYAAAGTYTVQLTVTDDKGATGTTSKSVTVTAPPPPPNQPPVAAFTSSCTNLACSFTDASSDPDGSVAGWSWSFGDGGTATTQNPSHTYGAAGTYTVQLTVTDDKGATGTTSKSVTVTAPPPPPNQPPTVTVTGGTVAVGLLYALQASFSDPDNGPWTYTIDWGDGTSGTGTASSPGSISATHTYLLPGSYRIVVTVTDSRGAVGSGSATLTVIV